MSAFTCSIVLFCATLLSCSLPATATDNVIDPSWLKPGALDRWEQRQRQQTESACEAQTQPTTECNCPTLPDPARAAANNDGITEEQKLSAVFYRKLVKTLFERDVLVLQPTGVFYDSVVSMKVTNQQLDKLLSEASSIREIDTTLSEILEQSNNIRRPMVVQENRCERLYNFLLELTESSLLHSVLPIVLMVLGCFVVSIVSRWTRLHPFLVLLLLILSITVYNKWKECNENLAQKTLERNLALQRGKPADLVTLPICDPLEVLVEATVSMQAVYFNALFKQFLSAYNEHTQNVGFMQQILIGFLLLGFAYIAVTTLLQVGIASGFRMVGNVLTTSMQFPRNAQPPANAGGAGDALPPQLPAVNLAIHIGDPTGRAQPRAELYRLESQRVEIVPDDPVCPAPLVSERTMFAIDAKQEEIEAKDTESRKEERPPKPSVDDEKETS